MKKILFLILLISALVLSTSCNKNKYKPVESTEEEARVVMTVSAGNEDYEVKYELYRMLFLNYKSTVDGGDESVWSSENKDEYVSEINDIIIGNVTDIYSAIHLAKALGFDPYSKEADEAVAEYVRLSVEGNGADIEGHGSYEEYLLALKERNMNYSVADLLFRYSLALNAIDEYYIGTTDEVLGEIAGQFEVTEDAVRSYYFGDEAARILHIYFSSAAKTEEDMSEYRDVMKTKSSPLDVALYIINTGSPIIPEELIDTATRKVSGIVVGKYSYDDAYYKDYTDAAFATQVGDVSDVIEVADSYTGYYVIYKLEKTSEHFTEKYDDIKLSYITNEEGKRLEEVEAELRESLSYENAYSEIVHKDIKITE